MSGLSFGVKGWIDSDGRADIDDVTLDAKRGPDGFVIEPGCCQNMRPILYETEPGDTIQMKQMTTWAASVKTRNRGITTKLGGSMISPLLAADCDCCVYRGVWK